MKASEFSLERTFGSDARKAFILRQGAGVVPVADLSFEKAMFQDVTRRPER